MDGRAPGGRWTPPLRVRRRRHALGSRSGGATRARGGLRDAQLGPRGGSGDMSKRSHAPRASTWRRALTLVATLAMLLAAPRDARAQTAAADPIAGARLDAASHAALQ